MKEFTAPAPVAGIVQKQHVAWMEMLQKLLKIAQSDDKNALEMGDVLVEIEGQFGTKHVWQAVESTGLSKQMAKHRLRVSKRFPKEHPIRATPLNWTHLRALSPLSDEEAEAWQQKCLKEQWGSGRLIQELEAAKAHQAVADGDPCIQCEQPLPEMGVISFSIMGVGRFRCCSNKCVIEYFQERAKEARDAGDVLAASPPEFDSEVLDLSQLELSELSPLA